MFFTIRLEDVKVWVKDDNGHKETLIGLEEGVDRVTISLTQNGALELAHAIEEAVYGDRHEDK